EIDREDVLVLLRRIFRVANGAVGSMVKPFRVLAHPGMVGRALEGDVERHLHPEPLGRAHEAPEIIELAESGMHGGVAALEPADRPRATRVARLRDERVVAPLAPRAADGVDRRHVDDIEAHALHIREPLDAIVERAVPAWHLALGARKELVPGGEARPHAVDDHLELTIVAGGVHTLLEPADSLAHCGLEERVESRLLRVRRPRSGEHALEQVCIGPGGPRPRLGDEPGAFQELTGEVRLASLRTPRHVVYPGGEAVRPGLNG